MCVCVSVCVFSTIQKYIKTLISCSLFEFVEKFAFKMCTNLICFSLFSLVFQFFNLLVVGVRPVFLFFCLYCVHFYVQLLLDLGILL